MGLCSPRIPNKIGSRMNRDTSVAAATVWQPAKAIFGIALLAGTILPAARLHAESANADYKHAQQAEARQDYDTAYEFYQKALQRTPQDVRFRAAFERIRSADSNLHLSKGRNLVRQGDTEGALAEFLHASEIDPGNEAAQQEIAKIRRSQGVQQPSTVEATPQAAGEQQHLDEMGSPIELTPVSNEPLTLHMNEDSKVIYQAIGKAAGINVLFDPDYTSKRIQVDLNNVTLLDALRIVGAMSNTFWRPITSNTIFVAANTRVKRSELDEQAVQTFYLTNAWQQNDLNDVQTAIRNVLPNAKVYGVASQNAIVMRGTPDELLLAEKLINDLDKPRSEVVVDFGVLEVSKNWERTLGIAWPSSIGVQLLPPNTTGTTSSTTTTTTTTGTTSTTNCNSAGTCLTLSNLAHLNSNDFAVTVGSATLNLLLTDGETQILQDPRIRATDGQKATLTIGSKIPIATGSYQTGAATALVSSLVNTQFQYIDVGAKIEMTPTVHFDDDVTLKVHVEISSESGSVTISGVTEPILSQRVVDQVIRLREGEASILGGINENQNNMTWTGIPGLSSIPILKYLFGSKDHTINDDEIVFVVVPHVVRGPDLDEANLRAIDVGEGQSVDLRHVSAPAQNMSLAPHPATITQPGYGTVPAGSAPAAAMEALSQLRSGTQNMETPPPVAHPGNPVPPANPATPLPPSGTGTMPAVTAPPTLEAAPVPANPAAGQAPAPAAGQAPAVPTALNMRFVPPAATVANGASFQVPIQLNAGTDISSVPLQFRYDPARLTLVNVTGGDLLGKDGQAMALIHRDDGPGNVTVVASRPPGTAGVSGSGTICVLTFTAKSPGPTTLVMTRAGAVNSKQQQANAPPTQAEIVVK
jgi:general secretion pathway protein D